MTEEELKLKLTPGQYEIMRQKGTEAAFTGKYHDSLEQGMFVCAACGNQLFASDTKFDSGTGWPSFTDPVNLKNIELHDDDSQGMHRIEVTCKNCGSHLGHVFDADDSSTGKHYCINSSALDFIPQKPSGPA